MVSILAIDGTKVEYTKRDLSAGLRPYGIEMSSDGSVAVVANIGRGGGDNDTVTSSTCGPTRSGWWRR
jgi:hypothetical protein